MVVFSDAFEANNFTAWTSTVGSPSIQTTTVNSGVYAASCTAANKYMYKNLASSPATSYYRTYVYASTIPTTNGQQICVMRLDNTSATVIWELDYEKTFGGLVCWRLTRNFPGYVDNDISFTLVAGSWYCVEVKFVRAASVGAYQVWVNGISIFSEANLDTSGAPSSAYRIKFGQISNNAITTTIYGDDVVVDSNYIGPKVVRIASSRLLMGVGW